MNRKERAIARRKYCSIHTRARKLLLAVRPMHRTYHVPGRFALRYLSTRRTHEACNDEVRYEALRFSIPHTMRDWPENVLRYVVRESAALRFNTHCTHEYDCCGNWYTSAYYVRRIDRRTLEVHLKHYRNV